ncbi:glucan endo-1,3-beta-glucosidase 7-like [Mangifera indica]|uniref:glucan endo-1,3-beta-glucosidase 7-like n=1 Tax=Mangifera indica TaxID=29780 RepID=UPI001CFB0EFF|nr:glucan endo-1,3-beta-glucosidase 7-like [Mangifera indica]
MLSFVFTFALVFHLSLFHGSSSLPTIGITYTPPPTTTAATTALPTPPPPERIASIVTSLNFASVRLPGSDPSIIRAFSYTNTSLLLSIPNILVPPLAANRSLALRWLYSHVLPFYPRSKISLISVGNDVFDTTPDFSPFLLPAIRNVHLALRDLGIKKVSVSTTFSFFNIITTSFPPSSAQFQEPAGSLILKPLIQFLGDTNSSFLVNLYPYNMYRLNNEIPIGFALFQDFPFNFRDDLVTGVRYKNLFDMMADSVVSAMAVAGHENIPIIVAETGWPSSGTDSGEVDATRGYAEMYLKGLVAHLRSGLGTPLRKEGVAEVYIYELVDEEMRGIRSWGILHQNLTKKYKVEFSKGFKIGGFGGLVMSMVFHFSILLCF